MMTDEQRYLFDLQGYLAVKNVLTPEEVASMQKDMDAHGIKEPGNDPNVSRFSNFLEWGPLWRNLIDHPKILPILAEIVGPRFRLDHAYGMASRAVPHQPSYLHHEAGMFQHGCYYVNHGKEMHNGLIVVSFALTDIKPGAGGFACVPGTHKALHKMPHQEWWDVEKCPIAKQVPQAAGDVVIFTEALTHGTWPWNDPNGERRSILLKYCPHYMQWGGLMKSDIEGLTERQKLILQGPYVWNRPTPKLDDAPTA